MECPKCRKTVGEHDAVCRNCGIALREKSKKTKSLKDFLKKKPDGGKDVPLLETSSGRKSFRNIVNGRNEAKIKLAFFIALAVLIVVLIWVFIVQISADKGSKKALEAAEFIGMPLTEAEKDMEIHFKDNSAFGILNSAAAFDYIYESEDELQIDDITYPEWSVTVFKDTSDNIDSVVYTNYKLLKKDSRGEKLDKRINLDNYDKGARYSSVSDDIGLDPYKVVYGKSSISYVYKYYYTAANSDAQSVLLTAVFDNDGKYQYYTSQDVYPQNL
ncbi:hypothetical protein Osc1_17910 [Hominimerdicola sp. 21CYCFAH17_S]